MKKTKKPKNQAPARRSKIGLAKREEMLAVLIRNPHAFQAVRELLTPEKLNEVDPAQALLWKVVNTFFEEHGKLPDRKLLEADLEDVLDASPTVLTEEEREDLDGLLDQAFDKKDTKIAKSKMKANWAIQTVRMVLEDLHSMHVKRSVVDEGMVSAELPELLQKLTQDAEAIASLQDKPASVPFPAGWEKGNSLELVPTGIGVLDRFLGGGHVAGEVNLFMGPYGSCKTLLAVMGLVEGARYAAGLTAEPDWDDRLPLSAIFSYEMRPEDLQERCLAYGASIPRERVRNALNSGNGLAYFSKSKLVDYEEELFKAELQAGEPVTPERTRARKTIELLNRHALFLDMTGSDPKRKTAGNGYVPEIARDLQQELRSRKKAYLVSVWVDYLGAMSKRHLEATNQEFSDLRHRLAGGVLLLGNLVAKPFQCPVWVNHQLSGAANARGPAARIHHTDAAEAKNVAENADFAIVTGNQTEEDQLCVFACTKHRRQARRSDVVVRVDGQFSRVMDVSSKYVVDRHVQRIVSKEDYEMGHGSSSESVYMSID